MDKKLELNKETLRELNDRELSGVAGGEEITKLVTQTLPSGATWLQQCVTVAWCP